MNASVNQAVSDTIGQLMALADEQPHPAEALDRVRSLGHRHPDLDFQLLWQREQYDGSVHYDLLLGLDGAGTLALAFSPERSLPWPLRGVQRSSERTLLRVNGVVLWVDEAIACLDFMWDDGRIIDRLVDTCIVRDVLRRQPIDLSPDELQEAMDAFRRARGLFTAEATRRWMARRGLTHAQLEAMVADEAVVAKLRAQVTADQVDAYLAAHAGDFDRARICRLRFDTAESASQAYAAIRAGELDFYAVAERAAADFADVRRGDAADPRLAAAVFAAAPGDVLAPLPAKGGFAVVKVVGIARTGDDMATRRAVERKLFDDWMEAQRAQADIDWNWGSPDRIDRARSTTAGAAGSRT